MAEDFVSPEVGLVFVCYVFLLFFKAVGEGERRGGEGRGDPDLILRHATKETTKCVEMSLFG